MSEQSWQIAILTYLLFVLVGGLALNVSWNKEARAGFLPQRRNWDNFDSWALLLVMVLGVVLVWLAVTLPLTGDEASELEPDFWQNWFFNPIRGSQPPLGRLLNNLWAFLPELKWLIRMPYILFWLIGAWIFYWLLRRRTHGKFSLILLALFILSGLHITPDHQQCKYALWLLALLISQGSFERALAGEQRQWVSYALWMWVASLTYYFTIPYAVGHFVFVVFKRRDQLRPHIKALLLSVLSLVPFAWPVLNGYADTHSSFSGNVGLSYGLLRIVMKILMAPGMLGLVLLWLAWHNRGNECKELNAGSGGSGALPNLIFLGLLFPFAFAGYLRMSSRLFIPILPFGLLWFAGKKLPKWADWRARQRWLTVAGFVFIVLIGASISINTYLEQKGDLWRQYARRTHFSSIQSGDERFLLVRSHLTLVLLYELCHSRKYWLVEQEASNGVKWYHLDQTYISALPDEFNTRYLEAVFARSPEFDLLWQRSRRYQFSGAVQAWLDNHCRVLLRSDLWPESSGVVYRCQQLPDVT